MTTEPREVRRYTVYEIDRMRTALRRRAVSGVQYTWDNERGQRIMAIEAAQVEDQLRTYMVGGIDPEELEQ